MIEVRGGNAGEYRDEVFADTRAPAPDNEKKPAAKQVPGNESPVNEVVNPAAKQISKEKEAVKETQHTAAKFDSSGACHTPIKNSGQVASWNTITPWLWLALQVHLGRQQ